jgi:hypothetical protein
MPRDDLPPRLTAPLANALTDHPKAATSQLATLDRLMSEAGVKFLGLTERNRLVALRRAYATTPERYGVADRMGTEPVEAEADEAIEGASITPLPNGGYAVDMNARRRPGYRSTNGGVL